MIIPESMREVSDHHNRFVKWLNDEYLEEIRNSKSLSFDFYFLRDENPTPVWLLQLATQFSVDILIPEYIEGIKYLLFMFRQVKKCV